MDQSQTTWPRRRWLLLLLVLSLLANLIAYGWYATRPSTNLVESHFFGETTAKDKIAIVRISGVISEATLAWPIRQLEMAAADPQVKAVVLRVDSPGGTISASDELYRCLVDVREKTGRRFPGTAPKPIVTSMGGMAASGGYYIATAGNPIFAERTTITGSIGVFVALPNAAEFGEKHGIKLELIKAGGIKASGSLFQTMSPLERQPWQDTVDHAYQQFLAVIASERPGLTPEKLSSETVIDRQVPERDSKGNVQEKTMRYTRVRADGGTFTPPQAKEIGLVDELGDLPAAVKRAAEKAGLASYRAIVYNRPLNWSERIIGFDLGVKQPAPAFPDLSTAFTPRLWYLAPNAEFAGIAAGP